MAATQPDSTSTGISRRGFLHVALASGALAPAALLAKRGVAPAWAQETPKKGGTLRVGFYIEAATMDPHLSGSRIDRQVYHNIYEPLVVLDANLGIKPGLAESW
jgi:peptide/nickel transport system substrate-binding protein